MNNLGLGIIVSMKDAFTQNAMRIQSSMETLDSSVEKASENMTRNLGLIERGTMMVGAGLALLAVPTALVASTAALGGTCIGWGERLQSDGRCG